MCEDSELLNKSGSGMDAFTYTHILEGNGRQRIGAALAALGSIGLL